MKKSAKTISSLLAALFSALLFCPTAFAAVGDINGDGKLQASDARLTLRYSARLEAFSESQIKRSDVNYDGKINSADARLMLKASSHAISLECYYQYAMTAVYTDPASGQTSTLETAWQNGKIYIRISPAKTLVYDSGDSTVAIIDDAARRYRLFSFMEFRAAYPQDAVYFENDGAALRFSDLLPTPLALEDQGFTRTEERGFTVYFKAYPSGYQRYVFDDSMLPAQCEYHYNGALTTLDIKSFSADPTALFTEYLSYTKS
ncbi:MAG: dockerin type I repeat-containing protein [Clostridia bacterium]|nr:dockerin type I repeat-containing protein [Clostridia bacterium]